MARFAVVGATSWGLTLGWLLSRNQHDVTVLCRSAEEANSVRGANGLARLPELRLPDSITCAAPPLLQGFDGVVLAVPAQSLRSTLQPLDLSRALPVLSAAKGIELASGSSMTAVLRDLGWPRDSVAAISGPNLAHEIARGMPAAAVIASTSEASAQLWQLALRGPAFRLYTSSDTAGVELAGAYKNVVAIAAGAGWGLQLGANTVSAIMTRGLAEMTRLGLALGADALTFQGLAGVGDLATTCFSPLSRNRRFGELLAAGGSAETARDTIGEAIEGIATAQVALELASREGIELPICAAVAAVVQGRKSVAQAMADLLARPLGAETPAPR